VHGRTLRVGENVFVKPPYEDRVKETSVVIQHWLAKILEIRAEDVHHVFLRVVWFYRPEDLPCGRQPHHESGELVVSNHPDIIDACTVQDTASVAPWDGDPDKTPSLASDQLFWRQSYDIKTNQLSVSNVALLLCSLLNL
jgi:hypothetical protein